VTVRSDLAPTGKLHAGINYGNVILAARDPASGEFARMLDQNGVRGVTVAPRAPAP
jgi:hypothetical protein